MMEALKPFDRGKARTPEQAMQDIQGYIPTDSAEPLPVVVGDFRIEGLAGAYRISGVVLDGEECVVDLDKELLDGGKGHTRDEWVKLTRKIPSAKLYTSIILTLCANKDHKDAQQRALVEEVREMLKQDFVNNYIMTSTRVAYQPQGKDKVMHNYGYVNEQAIDGKLVGSDGYIDASCGFGKELEALLGTSDCAQIEQAYEWLGGKKPYLSRINQKPEQETLRAVVLGLNVIRFNIIADSDVIVYVRPARGCDLVGQKISGQTK